jgi:hypothetical protein
MKNSFLASGFVFMFSLVPSLVGASSQERSLGILYLSEPGQGAGANRAYKPSGRMSLVGSGQNAHVAIESEPRQLFSKALKRHSEAPGDLGSGYPAFSKKWAEIVRALPCPPGRLRVFFGFTEAGGDNKRGYEWGVNDVRIQCAGDTSFNVCTQTASDSHPNAYFNEPRLLKIFKDCQLALEAKSDGGAEGSSHDGDEAAVEAHQN